MKKAQANTVGEQGEEGGRGGRTNEYWIHLSHSHQNCASALNKQFPLGKPFNGHTWKHQPAHFLTPTGYLLG